MKEPKSTERKKDKWDKFEIFSKSILAIFVPVVITIFGFTFEARRAGEAETNRGFQVLIQSLANRESVGAELKAKMFATLMEHFFRGKEETKIAILEMLALNLNDQFQLRPLFERVNASLTTDQEKNELKRVSKNIARRQIDQIKASGGDSHVFALKKNAPIEAVIVPLSLTLIDVKEGSVMVSTTADSTQVFEINYFDYPFSDNTKIGEMTYSLVLTDTNEKDESAKIILVTYPQHHYSIGDRLQLDQLLGRYLGQKIEFLGR